MTKQGKIVGDGKVRAEQLESIVVELLCVVRDDNLKNFKSIDDVLPYENFGIPLSDFGKRLCLYPLCKVVYGDNQKLSLQWSLW